MRTALGSAVSESTEINYEKETEIFKTKQKKKPRNTNTWNFFTWLTEIWNAFSVVQISKWNTFQNMWHTLQMEWHIMCNIINI